MSDAEDPLQALHDGPTPPLDRDAAAVSVADIDAVAREVLARIEDAEVSEDRSAAYVEATEHFEQALKTRLALDHYDRTD